MAELSMRPDEDMNTYVARLRELYSSGQITAEEYFAAPEREWVEHCLQGDTPRAQAGYDDDIYRWRNIRWMILEAVYGGGTFIDIGCANGHLIETLDTWMSNSGVEVEFYGLEIYRGLLDLAKRRLPDFASRLFLGNALYWKPPFRFDYVYSMVLVEIPQELRKLYLDNLFENCLKPGGRLILGPSTDENMVEELQELGFTPSGSCEKTVPGRAQETRRLVWIDKAPQPAESKDSG